MDGKVYVILQRWQTSCESGTDIIAIYESKEKAIDRLKAEYEQDIVWLENSKNCNQEDFDENEHQDLMSIVRKNETFSINEMDDRYLIK